MTIPPVWAGSNKSQDAKTAHILWLGGFGCSNRRKQACMGSIDTTISS